MRYHDGVYSIRECEVRTRIEQTNQSYLVFNIYAKYFEVDSAFEACIATPETDQYLIARMVENEPIIFQWQRLVTTNVLKDGESD